MSLCCCGSGQSYAQCCQPYHQGQSVPATPEALMRSRYSAYCLADIPYIQATMAGKASTGYDPVSAKTWAKNVIWIRLQVLNTGQSFPTQGYVEFIASFVEGKTLYHMHEISEFHLIDGRWFYVDGIRKPTTTVQISCNMPCPCGSSKKWKHCHGN